MPLVLTLIPPVNRCVIQSGHADYCAAHDIKLISFGAIGSGILSDLYVGRGKPEQQELDSYSICMRRRLLDSAGVYGRSFQNCWRP